MILQVKSGAQLEGRRRSSAPEDEHFCSKGPSLQEPCAGQTPFPDAAVSPPHERVASRVEDMSEPNQSRIAQPPPADVIQLWGMGLGIWTSVSWLILLVCFWLVWFGWFVFFPPKSFLGQSRAASFMQGRGGGWEQRHCFDVLVLCPLHGFSLLSHGRDCPALLLQPQ